MISKRILTIALIVVAGGVAAFAATSGSQQVLIDDKANEELFKKYRNLLDKLKIEAPIPVPKIEGPTVINSTCAPAEECQKNNFALRKKQRESKVKQDAAINQNRLLEQKEEFIKYIVHKEVSGTIKMDWIKDVGGAILTAKHSNATDEVVVRINKEELARAQALADMQAHPKKAGMKNASFHPSGKGNE